PVELVVHRVALVARENPEDEARELRRSLEVLDVRGQHDLLPVLPAKELERSAADRLGAERFALSLDQVSRNDLGVADREDRHERGERLVKCDFDGMSIERDEPRHGPRAAFPELASPSDPDEEVGGFRTRPRIEESRERIDHVIRGDLASVMELGALAKLECPGKPVPGRTPEFGQRRLYCAGLVELPQAVEDLLRPRPAVDVADAGRIERLRIVPERAPVNGTAVRLMLLLGRRQHRAGAQKRAQENAEQNGGQTAPPIPEGTD